MRPRVIFRIWTSYIVQFFVFLQLNGLSSVGVAVSTNGSVRRPLVDSHGPLGHMSPCICQLQGPQSPSEICALCPGEGGPPGPRAAGRAPCRGTSLWPAEVVRVWAGGRAGLSELLSMRPRLPVRRPSVGPTPGGSPVPLSGGWAGGLSLCIAARACAAGRQDPRTDLRWKWEVALNLSFKLNSHAIYRKSHISG